MKQVYYETANRGMDIIAMTPGLEEAAQQLVKEVAVSETEPGVCRFALFHGKQGRRALLQAVPVEGTRRGFSFTHALVLEPGELPEAADLLRGWGDPFWRKQRGGETELAPVDVRQLPWQNDRQNFDTRLRRWAQTPNSRTAVAAVLRTLFKSSGSVRPRVYMMADPEDVFWTAYAVCRLMPRALVDQFSFSTFERPMWTRDARLVGGRLADGEQPPEMSHLFLDFANPRKQEMGPGDGGYAQTVFAQWLEKPRDVDRMLANAADITDAGTLDVWLRMSCQPEQVSDPELLEISADPRWQRAITSSPQLLWRILSTDQVAAEKLIAIASAEVQNGLAATLSQRLADAIASRTPDQAQRLFQMLKALPKDWRLGVKRSIAKGSPAKDASAWLLLAGQLGNAFPCEPVFNAPQVVAEIAQAGQPGQPSTFVTTWVMQNHQRLDAQWPHILANSNVWQQIKTQLALKEARRAEFFSTLARNLAPKDAQTAGIRDLLIVLMKSYPQEADALLKAAAPGQWFTEEELAVTLFNAGQNVLPSLLPALVSHALEHPACPALDDKKLRKLLLTIPPDGLSKQLAKRWRILNALDKLNGLSPESTATALVELNKWLPERAFGGADQSEREPVAGAVLNRISLIAAGEDDADLEPWCRHLAPVWNAVGRDFWAELLSAFDQLGDERTRMRASWRAIHLAQQCPELRQQLDTWIATLKSLEAQEITRAIDEELKQNYYYHLVAHGLLHNKPAASKVKSWLPLLEQALIVVVLALAIAAAFLLYRQNH